MTAEFGVADEADAQNLVVDPERRRGAELVTP
jgi:hypothetical protein